MAEPIQNKETKKWEFIFDYYEKGKRKQIRRRGFKTKREANDMLITLQKEVQDNEYIGTNKTTVGAFIQKWLETERKFECEATTHYNNTLYLKNHIIPRIGDLQLQKLDAQKCQDFVNDMHEEGYARNSIDRVVTMIKIAFDRAVVYKVLKENYMRKVKLPKMIKKEMSVWSSEQLNTFLQFTKNKRHYCAYALALFTGMRQGEILGLRWKDIDFKKKIISINQTVVRYGTEIKQGAKTKSGVRTISIPNQLIEILLEQQKKSDDLKKELGTDFSDKDLVIFNLRNGGVVFPVNLSNSYRRDVKASGLPHIPFHGMRHTHATMLIKKNVNVKLISERLGHSKIGITLDTYSHVTPNMQQELAEQIDELISL